MALYCTASELISVKMVVPTFGSLLLIMGFKRKALLRLKILLHAATGNSNRSIKNKHYTAKENFGCFLLMLKETEGEKDIAGLKYSNSNGRHQSSFDAMNVIV